MSAAAFPLALALGAQACSDRGAGVLQRVHPDGTNAHGANDRTTPPVETASSDAPAGTAGSA